MTFEDNLHFMKFWLQIPYSLFFCEMLKNLRSTEPRIKKKLKSMNEYFTIIPHLWTLA